MERAREHYEAVTEVWRKWVMGEELHFGYFTGPTDSMSEASNNLTMILAAKGEAKANDRVLDIGCGVGTPAIYLANSLGCDVLGISTSQVGVAAANEKARSEGASGATFEVRDGTKTGLEDESFDLIFSLESAHLMSRDDLFSESFRLLRPGKGLTLCDVTLVGKGSEDEQIAGYRALGHSVDVARRMRRSVHAKMHEAFGSSALPHVDEYVAAAERAGFVDVEVIDISSQTRPTLEQWARAAHDNAEQIEEALGRRYLDDFFVAVLHMSFSWGKDAGYILLTANKPDSPRGG